MLCSSDKYVFFHPTMSVAMAGATLTPLPTRGKGQEKHIDLGPHASEVTPELPALGLVI